MCVRACTHVCVCVCKTEIYNWLFQIDSLFLRNIKKGEAIKSHLILTNLFIFSLYQNHGTISILC